MLASERITVITIPLTYFVIAVIRNLMEIIVFEEPVYYQVLLTFSQRAAKSENLCNVS
jgi:hypothetical protein